MLRQARQLLRQGYEGCLEKVKDSDYFVSYADEKFIHSQQVLGAGNYILKHEKWFASQSEQFIDMTKAAILLHDIGRFDQISGQYADRSAKFDHGPMGALKLAQLPTYNDIRITLPIKHHGHLIEDFYADEEWKTLNDEKLKEEIEQIIFAIRDADKIANFNLIMYDKKMLMPLFVPYLEDIKDKRQQITDKVLEDFFAHSTVNHKNIATQADEMLTYIGWIFDINYPSSIRFCQKLNLIEMMFDTLLRFHNDKELNKRLKNEMNDYIRQRFGL